MIVRLLTEYKLADPWPTIPVGTLGQALAVPPGFLTVHFDDYPPVSAKAEDLEPVDRLMQLRHQVRQVRLSPAAVLGFFAFVGLFQSVTRLTTSMTVDYAYWLAWTCPSWPRFAPVSRS